MSAAARLEGHAVGEEGEEDAEDGDDGASAGTLSTASDDVEDAFDRNSVMGGASASAEADSGAGDPTVGNAAWREVFSRKSVRLADSSATLPAARGAASAAVGGSAALRGGSGGGGRGGVMPLSAYVPEDPFEKLGVFTEDQKARRRESVQAALRREGLIASDPQAAYAHGGNSASLSEQVRCGKAACSSSCLHG
jgi:hypothetical protein